MSSTQRNIPEKKWGEGACESRCDRHLYGSSTTHVIYSNTSVISEAKYIIIVIIAISPYDQIQYHYSATYNNYYVLPGPGPHGTPVTLDLLCMLQDGIPSFPLRVKLGEM